MTILDLLDQPATNQDNSPTIGDRLAELTYKNSGRLIVANWGPIEIGGLYGYIGLQEHEAMELTHLGGLIRGFGMAQPNPAAIDREVTNWIRSRWARQPRWAESPTLHT